MGVAGPTLVRSLFLDWSSIAIGGILTQQGAGAKCGSRCDAIEYGGKQPAGRWRYATDETFSRLRAYLVAREVSHGSTDASDEAEAQLVCGADHFDRARRHPFDVQALSGLQSLVG